MSCLLTSLISLITWRSNAQCVFIRTLSCSEPWLGIVIYLHIEGALYAQKSVPSWFLAVFDSKIDVC